VAGARSARAGGRLAAGVGRSWACAPNNRRLRPRAGRVSANCGQLPTPNSVIGAATLTTASHGTLREAPRAVSGKPTRTGGA
jgi:hypothetical protein